MTIRLKTRVVRRLWLMAAREIFKEVTEAVFNSVRITPPHEWKNGQVLYGEPKDLNEHCEHEWVPAPDNLLCGGLVCRKCLVLEPV